MAKFKLGQVLTTAGVAAKCEDSKEFSHFVQKSLGRYYKCDWGETCEEDCKVNDDAVRDGDRILAAYHYKEESGATTVIWIITEWDRSATTILFPDEY